MSLSPRLALAACLLAAAAPLAAASCGGIVVATGAIAGWADPATLVLADGTQVRLDGIEIPPGPPGARYRDAARALAEAHRGTTVTIVAPARAFDRYGRLRGHAVLPGTPSATPATLQQLLLAQGLARVAPRTGGRGCAATLWPHEGRARRAKLGLWADPYYDLARAETPQAALAATGRLALVEGRIVSVRESGATIYLNFGRRWTEDFTVTIAKRDERRFQEAGLEPRRLAGRHVRIRGWIEERGGPWIEATQPEQIELVTERAVTEGSVAED